MHWLLCLCKRLLRMVCPRSCGSKSGVQIGPRVFRAGGLPGAWGSAGAFPLLRVLAIKNSSLAGPLPDAWGNSTKAMPSLTILTLDSNALSYSLPASWAQGFPSLS